jgi:hypothetical protein
MLPSLIRALLFPIRRIPPNEVADILPVEHCVPDLE